MADENRIQQVVINFINNAIKYAPKSRQIFLTIEKDIYSVKVSVRDTGPGIPAEKLPYLLNGIIGWIRMVYKLPALD